jgi:adenosyl cobinamide kinase/adenosyl cobinamide phosphate guanylyltransferase
MSGLILLVGGARSGKSALAVEIGRRHDGPVAFLATCAAGEDEDLAVRIERHRAARPDWPTIEEPVELLQAVEKSESLALVIVDCLTLWVSNLMLRGDSDDEVAAAAAAVVARLRARAGAAVVVSNEVGSGVHPERELGRRYCDLLGRVNQIAADGADTALLVVAGRAVRLGDPWTALRLRLG